MAQVLPFRIKIGEEMVKMLNLKNRKLNITRDMLKMLNFLGEFSRFPLKKALEAQHLQIFKYFPGDIELGIYKFNIFNISPMHFPKCA